MQQWVQSTVQEMAWQWMSAHTGHIAAAIALALLAFMFVSMVTNVLAKHTGAMLASACLLAVVAWRAWPQAPPPPKPPPVVQREPVVINLPELPKVKLPEFTLPKIDWEELRRRAEERRKREDEARRLADERRKAEEQARKLAEADARRKAREEALRRKKLAIRARNDEAIAIMENWMAAEMQQLQAEEIQRQRAVEEYQMRMLRRGR